VPTWRELVEEAVETLTGADVPDPANSARWIGRQATGTDAAEWLEVAAQPATQRQLAAFDRMVARRCEGEPLQYVVGGWGFRTLDLFVDRRVLIPRPETEVVAGRAIDELDRVLGIVERPDRIAVVDLGTGSGAIGLSVAAERPGTEVWLTDASAEALEVARANLAGLGRHGGTVRLAEGRWFDAVPPDLAGTLAVVVSNPPYVASVDDLEPGMAAREPEMALLADDEGRADLIELIDEAPSWLAPVGALVLEMDPRQVPAMVARAGTRFAEVEAFADLVGRARGLVARRPRR
jgi:release factor glutamine methyltransferase